MKTDRKELEELLSAKEVAAKLGVAPKTVRAWVKDGKIPTIILPGGGMRFKPAQLNSWMEKNSIRQRVHAI